MFLFPSSVPPNREAILMTIIIISGMMVSHSSSSSLRRRSSSSSSSSSSSEQQQQQQQNRNLWTHLTLFSDPQTTHYKYHPLSSSSSTSFQRATAESYGFFNNISDDDWDRMRRITRGRQQEQPSVEMPSDFNYDEMNVAAYYHENWESDFSCPRERRVGKMGDGGKWVCDPHRIKEVSSQRKTSDGRDSPCLVYSVGSNGNHFFEHGVMDTIGEDVCEIHTFEIRSFEDMLIKDFTPEEKRKSKKVNFHYNWGLRTSSDPPAEGLYTLQETIEKLGHVGRTIDIFKIDCEGCEWTSYKDWLTAPAMLQQILVEVHAVVPSTNDFFERLRKEGYVTFHKEPNTISRGRCLEYAFLKLMPDVNDYNDDFALAKKESFGFFYDVGEEDWEVAKSIMNHRQNYNHARKKFLDVEHYYQENWEPDFSCMFEERFGNMKHEEKYWICDPHRIPEVSDIRRTPDGKPDPCLIYSISTGGTHGFELDFVNDFENICEIHIFDARSEKDVNLSELSNEDKLRLKKINVHYDWRIRGSQEDVSKGHYTLEQTIQILAHEGRSIDVMAVNCHACEWRIFRDWFTVPAYILQIAVEVHGHPRMADEFFQKIQDNGYVTFHKEMNYLSYGTYFYYSFLKLNIGGGSEDDSVVVKGETSV